MNKHPDKYKGYGMPQAARLKTNIQTYYDDLKKGTNEPPVGGSSALSPPNVADPKVRIPLGVRQYLSFFLLTAGALPPKV